MIRLAQDEETSTAPATQPRTEAQREASRQNGRRSRGPKTQKGKARSSRNSLRHGLYAKKLAPPDGDPAELDKAYWDFHAQLRDEFAPESFTERALVADLASHYLQLARVTHMIESLQAVHVEPELMETCETVRQRREELSIVAAARDQIDAGEALDFDSDDARKLAALIAQYVAGVYENFAQLEAEVEESRQEAREAAARDPLRPDDAIDDLPEEDEEDIELRQLVAELEPARDLLTNRQTMQALFTGERAMRDDELEPLRRVCDDQQISLQGWIDYAGRTETQVTKAIASVTDGLAQDPEQLMRLEDYRVRLYRAIERHIDRLER